MPRGGARVGSGPKPKLKPGFVPELVDGGRSGEDTVSSSPPADLPADQAGFWKTYARTAITARTLTGQTIGAFRLLCELDAAKRKTSQKLDEDGLTYIKCVVDGAGNEHQELKAHPLTSHYRQLAQRVEALMARFGLAPFGKPVETGKPKKTAANPWAKVAGQ